MEMGISTGFSIPNSFRKAAKKVVGFATECVLVSPHPKIEKLKEFGVLFTLYIKNMRKDDSLLVQ